MLELKKTAGNLKPLDTIELASDQVGKLLVRDGKARAYFEQDFEKSAELKVSGALGTHLVQIQDSEDRVIEETTFNVDCQTFIRDKGDKFKGLFDMLYYTLHTWGEGATTIWVDGKFYKFFVCWLRDHVHTLKGMKYFEGDIKTGIELYADTQQPNGMIWDRHEDKGPYTDWRDFTFAYGGFTTIASDGVRRFERIPVENDVEYLFLEGLYFTWKATGDDEWMMQYLDNALKAVEYSTTDPYRWSEKFKLLKRGYTIDTWDFQAHDDIIMTGGAMCVDKDKSYFGVMHGDNTGMIAALRYLAEMLEVAGRDTEAKQMSKLADDLKKRLDKVSWNGEFYTHHVPEKPNPNRDLG
ncbi:MAG: hypothetical protein ACOC2L_05640, partial [Candidatus Sumerlaeota bacterium]